ncbi:MAG: tyrosine--tRNA ligase [Omnitrophica bacterium RIFCSPHIGHO2_02_FULL_46_11]|nr:MAG: tyrosine--tRNA ligase [Omnitrophica bacterium RIFCSPHIGHO2_02_FULL_46_11]OGW85938.1 MAG: tyrosine--tRNA ligase [Omnitrophica bacterium RIFCSPLOWO2_01_FULL_45_10b]
MNPADQLKIFKEGTVDLISEEELLKKLGEKRSLRIKYGADPSAPGLHLGHTVPLRKLKRLQDLGHKIVFIIGDFTARVGDPSGQTETRRALSEKEVKENANTYEKQVFRILDAKKTEVRYNSEWLGKFRTEDFLNLAAKYTVARILERDDFAKRYRERRPITILELLYPLLQGYDSLAVESDVELGGTDQKFNLLVGREFQREAGKIPQIVMTLPIIPGTDGKIKMSKSLNNHIALQDAPKEMFGKIMSLPDPLMPMYFQYTSGMAHDQYHPLVTELLHSDPRKLKVELAKEIVTLYYGKEEAKKAQDEFDRIFRDKGLPDEIPTLAFSTGKKDLVSLLAEAGLTSSKSEARRLIEQGGVKINQEKISDPFYVLEISKDPVLIQCGNRKFVRIKTR